MSVIAGLHNCWHSPRFVDVTDLYEPLESGKHDHVYISKSYDATSHFETTTDDVMDIYLRIEGRPLVLKKRPSAVLLYSRSWLQSTNSTRRKNNKLGWHRKVWLFERYHSTEGSYTAYQIFLRKQGRRLSHPGIILLGKDLAGVYYRCSSLLANIGLCYL